MAEATVEAARSPYKPVTPAIVDELKSIVGEPYVIFGDAERMADYAHDEVPGEEYVHMPEVVVRVANARRYRRC